MKGVCLICPEKKKPRNCATCGTLGKDNTGMRPNQKIFHVASMYSEELFVTSVCFCYFICFTDTVLTDKIKLNLPEFERCTVLQVIGCKHVG